MPLFSTDRRTEFQIMLSFIREIDRPANRAPATYGRALKFSMRIPIRFVMRFWCAWAG